MNKRSLRRIFATAATTATVFACLTAGVAAPASAAPSQDAAHATQSITLPLTSPRLAVVPASTSATAVQYAAGNSRVATASICYSAHVQNIGWQNFVCDGATAGTTGLSLRLEALQIRVPAGSLLCANAHVQNIGWQGQECASSGTITVGTTGQSLRMEALQLFYNGLICADAHVQNIGWQGTRCTNGGYITVGTVGQSLRMEAIRITVR